MDTLKKLKRSPHRLEWFRKALSEQRFDADEIDRLLADDSSVPRLSQSEALLAAWRAIFPFRQQAPGWLEASVKQRQGQPLQAGQQSLDFYDETSPVYDRLTEALGRLHEARVDEKDILLVMREAQKHAIAHFLLYLDGGTGGGSHLYEQVYEDGEFYAGRSFCDLETDFLRYDPEADVDGRTGPD